MFKPYKLSSTDGKISCLAVDGGLVMNNPTAAAVTHVLHNKRDFPSVTGVDDLLVLSIGNGPLSSPSTVKLTPKGNCSTGSVLGIVFDGVSETIDQMLADSRFLKIYRPTARKESGGGVGGEEGVIRLAGNGCSRETNGQIEGLGNGLSGVNCPIVNFNQLQYV
ncbi:putative inactive patatin-like protein 9 [Sesamum angolense]|uniref:Inactive patatin-like protein 9 n=1 Tax=Sesamum angolense TaxID=2727404 RepID=A0AAE1X8A7_9LAMI|nr:putative inactive patatin-like protein 9 [Sesamum angolense]